MPILLDNNKPIIVFQGGTGSGKTYCILHFIIIDGFTEWENKTIDILRRTTPAMKRSVMKDFFDILFSLDMYDINLHNRTDSTYKIRSNLIRFYSADEEQKMRGLRRDVVYFNEALEFKRIDIMQVMMRTHELIFMDYNPSDEFHWIYDEINKRDDVNFSISTYRDNPFLGEKTIHEIERLKDIVGNKPLSVMEQILVEAKCPRILNDQHLSEREENIKKNISSDYTKLLTETNSIYEEIRTLAHDS